MSGVTRRYPVFPTRGCFFLLSLCLLHLLPPASLVQAASRGDTGKGNTYPLVLLHGFCGWGREEMGGYLYWGGGFKGKPDADIQAHINDRMRQQGHPERVVMTAVVGPFSSNWDRACELYAYIKGGRVDYGKAHSKDLHQRYGAGFPGIYPAWDEGHKIHLVTHSMGGQTARLLVQLLEQGDPREREQTEPKDLSPLFRGEKRWVHSVTTISTPHDGTSLAVDLVLNKLHFQNLGKVALSFLDVVVEFAFPIHHPDNIFDFKLEQWGLARTPGESWHGYVKRVMDSRVWDASNTDFSTYDVSPDGARELNRRVAAQPDVYYFSWATKTTKKTSSGTQKPRSGTFLPFQITALYIGQSVMDVPGHVKIDPAWWPSDGVVNTNSMDRPSLGSSDRIVEYRKGAPLKRGVWNYHSDRVLDPVCHSTVIGILPGKGQMFRKRSDLLRFYVGIAEDVWSLPADSGIEKYPAMRLTRTDSRRDAQ